MRKKLPTATTEAEPHSDSGAYVLLADGTVARRLKPLRIGDSTYYRIREAGKVVMIRADRLDGRLPRA